MPRRESEALERRDIMLYKGDWGDLQILLASTRVTPTAFIRALVRRTIRRIEATKAGIERPVEEDIDDRIIADAERDSITTDGSPA